MADLTYVSNTFSLYRSWFRNVTFVVVSDNIKWCKQNVKDPDVVFSPFTNAFDDFALLTSCDHVIVTSGTFGWWGAWLSSGKTVYFSGYPRPNSKLSGRINTSDYYPGSWIGFP